MNTAEELYAEVKALFQPAMNEARRRTLASRAYYAGYHFLLEKGLVPTSEEMQDVKNHKPNSGSHGLYLRWLGESDDRSVRRAGALLAQIYQHRINADYRLRTHVSPNDARDAIAVLEELIEETLI